MWHLRYLPCLLPALVAMPGSPAQQVPSPPPAGVLVDIGGQRLHVNCAGRGSPTVILESGTGDVSVIWALVQPEVAKFTRVCSYDRGGYAWSDPGNRPRTFAQLALELRTALQRLNVDPPYVLVGQSYGGLVIRGFVARYPRDVAGMVLVDAVHEDQQVVYGGQPHRIRESAKGRPSPIPRIARGPAPPAAVDSAPSSTPEKPLEAPFDRLPLPAQRVWRWAESQPQLQDSQSAELDWSPEEHARMHAERLSNRATLGDLPLAVLARTTGGYPAGMSVTPEALEKERRELQADLALLSRRGKLVFAEHAGHNLHLEDPGLVVRSIEEIVKQVREERVESRKKG
jgi:pimeloyl-ACP methyl ester carboxylesterase